MTDVNLDQQVVESVVVESVDVNLDQMLVEAVVVERMDIEVDQVVVEVVHSGSCPIITPSVTGASFGCPDS